MLTRSLKPSMRSVDQVEHFVTLFDSNYLPMGLCLHRSLMQQAQPFHLWIVCMDDLAAEQLHALKLPNVSVLPLADVETPALLAVKPTRSRGEYCWTLTPFTPQFVFERDASVERVTYLDADVFLFASPQILLQELEQSGKDVLITPHAYAPEYDRSATSGIFCVQFMTFLRNAGGLEVSRWWQDRCIEWCYARYEDGKFGDQKYLDDWPQRFPSQVHVLTQVEKTLAPWNVKRILNAVPQLTPVLYHFHSLKIVAPDKIHLFGGYRIGSGRWIYDRYMTTMKSVLQMLKENQIDVPYMTPLRQRWHRLRAFKKFILHSSTYQKL
jgi:hypothetical protein